ncbi:outer membrane beta-barrel protein, partial [bacterium]|nr:outer membrane beta-barrel protein [bacterium]
RKVIPSIALKQEYSDNLYFDSQSRQSDFITTVSPGLVLVNNTERLKAGLKLQLDSAYYQDHTDMDSVDQDF